MAPEQIEGHPRAASDQYALGVVVYEWLCGARPFEGSLIEVLVQHLAMPPPPWHEKGATIPAELEHVVLRALAKDPEARFASVQDFAEVFQEVGDATQSLALRASSDRLLPEQIPPPDIVPAPRHEPSLQKQARSSSTTQPLAVGAPAPRWCAAFPASWYPHHRSLRCC
jgi:serine/threonine-protein kinase